MKLANAILTDVNLVGALNKILDYENMPISAGYAVNRLIAELNEVLQKFGPAKQEILKKYGVDLGEGRFGITPDNAEGQQEYLDLLAQEFNISYEKCKLEIPNDFPCKPKEIPILEHFFDLKIKEA